MCGRVREGCTPPRCRWQSWLRLDDRGEWLVRPVLLLHHPNAVENLARGVENLVPVEMGRVEDLQVAITIGHEPCTVSRPRTWSESETRV